MDDIDSRAATLTLRPRCPGGCSGFEDRSRLRRSLLRARRSSCRALSVAAALQFFCAVSSRGLAARSPSGALLRVQNYGGGMPSPKKPLPTFGAS
jgi:hypothetical protein